MGINDSSGIRKDIMENGNTCLQAAKNNRDDEFYTTYESIEEELSHYTAQFRDRTVYCNCDDPYRSEFTRYFLRNFNALGLKRLICTSYSGLPGTCRQLYLFSQSDESGTAYLNAGHAYLLDVSDTGVSGRDLTEEETADFLREPGRVTELSGNGDFRSPECLRFLDECDVFVTNPPFSLFREFVGTVMEHERKFLIIGGQNALTYKEIFPLIRNGEVWTGYRFGEMKFRVPDSSAPRNTRYWVDEQGQKWRSLGNVMWLTNLDTVRRHEFLHLTKKYSGTEYPKYDDYDAINVKTLADIPYDYDGIMGVPVTILSRYNSEQFELVGEANHGSDGDHDLFRPTVNGRILFKRILIRNRMCIKEKMSDRTSA